MKNIVLACWLAAAMPAFGQAPVYPYAVKAFAGANPLGDGGPAAQALLFSPSAVALDLTGNIFILDSSNYRIRKIGVVDGKISTIAQLQLYGNDMKLGADGFFYVTASAAVLKVSPTGAVTIIAGTGSPGPIEWTSAWRIPCSARRRSPLGVHLVWRPIKWISARDAVNLSP